MAELERNTLLIGLIVKGKLAELVCYNVVAFALKLLQFSKLS